MEGQYSILDLSKIATVMRWARFRASFGQAVLWGVWLIACVIAYFLCMVALTNGSSIVAIAPRLGHSFTRLRLPFFCMFLVFVIGICYSAVRMSTLKARATMSTNKLIQKSLFVKKLAANELADISDYYFPPFNRLAKFGKNNFERVFNRSAMYIDWFGNAPRQFLPVEWLLFCIAMAMATATIIQVLFKLEGSEFSVLLAYGLILLCLPRLAYNLANLYEVAAAIEATLTSSA